MKRRQTTLKYLVALLALMAAIPRTRAQYRDWLDQQDPSRWSAVPRLAYLRTDVEAERNVLHSDGAGRNL